MQPAPIKGETIAAIATAPGAGAISIIRVSGDQAIPVVDRIYRGHAKLADVAGNTVHYGRIVSLKGELVDEVLATVFKSPRSYTGEDVVEIGCHGGAVVAPFVLSLVLDSGARQAEPGEFTRRAFLNSRIDLSQAEAVADMIAARSRTAQAHSFAQLQGSLGQRVAEIRDEIIQICSLLEIDLDFSEEGIELVSPESLSRSLRTAQKKVVDLEATYKTGRVLREGVRVAIAGPPNVGKSSLFNALLGSDRSIVSEEPGTTRDFVEESLTINGVLFSLVDTAGDRESTGSVEMEGIRRAVRVADSCDVILAVADATDRSLDDYWEKWFTGRVDRKVLMAINKIDLSDGSPPVGGWLEGRSLAVVSTSAKTGVGLDDLKNELGRLGLGADPAGEVGLVVVNSRHADVLRRTAEALGRALSSVDAGASNEFIAVDAREAISVISEITGEVTSEDILNVVFSRFCVGK